MGIILSILFIVFYVLSFPPFSIFFLSLPALFIIFALYFEIRISDMWLLVIWWIVNFLLLYWITYAISYYGGVSMLLGVIPTLLLSFYLSIYPLIFFKVMYKFKTKLLFPVYGASTWVVLDYLRAHLLSGFPWEIVGYSVFPFAPAMNISDIGGIYLIEFIMIFFVSSFFSRNKIKWIKISLFLLIGSIAYGEMDILYWNNFLKKKPSIVVGVAQGNIDQSVKWTPAYRDRTLKIYEDLTNHLSKKGSSIVVWPETAVPFYFQSSFLSSKIRKLAEDNKMYLLFGSPGYIFNGDRTIYTNRAYMLSPSGEILGYYDKVHLVPFGEYLPLRKYLRFVEKIIPMVGDMGPGKEIKPLPFKDGKIGVLICYESIFPEITREMVKKGATLLANITDDAWFGKTSAPFQHFSMVAFRAVESKRYLIRSANTGISGFISPTGKIIKWTPIFKRATVQFPVKEVKYITLYTRFGNWIVWVSMVFIVVMVIEAWFNRKKKEFKIQ